MYVILPIRIMFQRLATIFGMLLAFPAAASAIGFVTFNELIENQILSTQYAPGVIFTPGINGVSGISNPSGPGVSFDEDTPLHLTHTNGGSVTGSIDGLLLHTFDDWLGAAGDPGLHHRFLEPDSIDLDAVHRCE